MADEHRASLVVSQPALQPPGEQATLVVVQVAILVSDAEPESPHFTADAIIRASQSGSFTIDAFIHALRQASFTIDAWIGTPFAGGSFTADAVIRKTSVSSFSADAVLFATRSGSFTVDAWIGSPGTAFGSFIADAVLRAIETGSFTADATIRGASIGSLTADAVIFGSQSGSFTVDAYIAFRLTVDAVLKGTQTSSFTIDAWIYSPRQDPEGGGEPGETPLISVLVDGVDITSDVVFSDATFTMQVNGQPGAFQFRVKDDDHTHDFTSGAEVTLDIDGKRKFGGYLMEPRRRS